MDAVAHLAPTVGIVAACDCLAVSLAACALWNRQQDHGGLPPKPK
jgi:hypothetical protein